MTQVKLMGASYDVQTGCFSGAGVTGVGGGEVPPRLLIGEDDLAADDDRLHDSVSYSLSSSSSSVGPAGGGWLFGPGVVGRAVLGSFRGWLFGPGVVGRCG